LAFIQMVDFEFSKKFKEKKITRVNWCYCFSLVTSGL
jgi:hypothetical protein